MLHTKQEWHYNDRGKYEMIKSSNACDISKKTGDAVLAPLGK